MNAQKCKGNFGKTVCKAMLLGIVFYGMTFSQLSAQKRGNLLSVSIDVPQAGQLPKTQNPEYALSLLGIQQLLLDVAQNPKDHSFIEESLKETGISIEDLLAAGLLREQDSHYVLGFSLFTQDDQRVLREVCRNFAEDLAEIYLARHTEFEEILGAYPLKSVDTAVLAYVLIGCFSLDWDGLRITKELGYRSSAPPKNPPFIGWVDDKRAKEFQEKKGLYWGSHNEYLDNGVAFTTFGDHATLHRYGFPDIVWQMARSIRLLKSPEEIQPVLVKAGTRALYGKILTPLGDIMLELRNGKRGEEALRDATGLESKQLKDLLTILEGLEYVRKVTDGYEAIIPVFSSADLQFIHSLMMLSRGMLTSWLKQNFKQIEANLSNLSGYKYGQPLEPTFYKIWHEIFGAANRILVEKNMFFDPYGEDRKYKGYLPVVWHMSVAGDLR